ncbi:iron-containing alcohol dehydrogenase [Sagittula sp. MA-2]|uniref:iron-containing alcohol dehydrogenase n=1 Tax=Sagittula sp. MA-2 TaxID=3048007 RepID=UPI0024C2AAD4|nr:iron-containing alcohol dehydrogenase [Sagittula sp. MA-2]WHZ36007.1 iron-containing alcohol dehydrogenase [Sagittula sp. MA-2]
MSLITYLTRIHFADRVLEDALSAEMERHGLRHLLVISDRDAAHGDGLDRLFAALPCQTRTASHFAGDIAPDLDLARALELLEQEGCDGIIGFGGLAALNLARTAASDRVPVITIPTCTDTVGLGPIDPGLSARPGRKAALPVAILCDATLTTSADPEATAAAGMDTLCQCLECFLGTAFNPPADGMALDGLRRAALSLETAVQDGRDLSARRELLAAALNAGLASEKGHGGIAAAAHGLEAIARSRRGILHGALLPEVLAFNAPAVHDRLGLVRMVLGLPADADPGERLVALAQRIGLPRRLSDIGIEEHMLSRAAQGAAADPANRTNPRHATGRDYERIMRAVL